MEHRVDVVRAALEGRGPEAVPLKQPQKPAGDEGLPASAARRRDHKTRDAGGRSFLRLRQPDTSGLRVKGTAARVEIVQSPYHLVVQDLPWSSAGKNTVSLDTDHPVGDLHREVDLMQGHHHSDPLIPGHAPENGEKLQLVPDVQIGGRLVEDDDLRLLTDGPGQQDPLPLAVADSLEGS